MSLLRFWQLKNDVGHEECCMTHTHTVICTAEMEHSHTVPLRLERTKRAQLAPTCDSARFTLANW